MRVLLITLLIVVEALLAWTLVEPRFYYDSKFMQAVETWTSNPSPDSKLALEKAERRAKRRNLRFDGVVMGLLLVNTWALVRLMRHKKRVADANLEDEERRPG